MVKLEFQVKESAGLLPETAGSLVKEAIQCTSNVQIRKGEKSGNAKLIFHVLSLSAKAGEKLELLVEGENEREDAKRLEAWITEKKFENLKIFKNSIDISTNIRYTYYRC